MRRTSSPETRPSAKGKGSGSGSSVKRRIAPRPRNQATPPTLEIGPGGNEAAETRRRMIAEEAYLLAERRGFERGDPLDDWLQAEREVDERLRRA